MSNKFDIDPIFANLRNDQTITHMQRGGSELYFRDLVKKLRPVSMMRLKAIGERANAMLLASLANRPLESAPLHVPHSLVCAAYVGAVFNTRPLDLAKFLALGDDEFIQEFAACTLVDAKTGVVPDHVTFRTEKNRLLALIDRW